MGIFDYLRSPDKRNRDLSEVKSDRSSQAPLQSSRSRTKSQPPPIPEDARVGRNGPRERDDEPITYRVAPGDTLSEIAQRHFGDGDRWREIYRANVDRIADPNALVPGQELVIPSDARHAD